MIKGVLGQIPLFGICFGHQLVALACGADTDRLKFGHRGSNHPVKNLETNRVEITSQNHGYTVNMDSIKGTDLSVTHVALNDGTVEGLKHKNIQLLQSNITQKHHQDLKIPTIYSISSLN